MRKHLEIEDNLREDKLFVIDKKGSGYYLDSSSDKIVPGKIPAGPTSGSANFDTDGLRHTFADNVDSEVTVKRRRSKKPRRHSSKIDIDETVLPVDVGLKNGHVGKVKHDGQHKRWSIDVSHADIDWEQTREKMWIIMDVCQKTRLLQTDILRWTQIILIRRVEQMKETMMKSLFVNRLLMSVFCLPAGHKVLIY